MNHKARNGTTVLTNTLSILAKSNKVKTVLSEQFGANQLKRILDMMRKRKLVGRIGDSVHDFLVDEIHNKSEVVWEARVRGGDNNLWPVWVRGYEGIYFVSSPDYDYVGYFLDTGDAESYVFGNWSEFVEEGEEE